MSAPSRRQLLIGGALAGSAGLMMNAGRVAGASPTEHPGNTNPSTAAPDGDGGVRHGGTSGATFRAGQQVNHTANGFHPTAMLRDFDYGTTSELPDGRTLREWEIFAADEEIEVAPGVYFPAWTFNSRIPGPALRCSEGDRLRVRFVNGSAHPHTMHFHGIHPADMDGIPGVGRGIIEPGESFTYEFDATPFGLHLYHCHVNPLAEHIARGMYGTFIV
ncbi:multicopper oxidase domain-containing protein, partial [Rhodococcus sp. (in: high G+C Gram-positive bacteria)]|uniref:multicopper oxidase domain-containing protein n=1 Tax=Rhodococcus sp. TaxID=1831 RepID=UPI002590E1B0